MSYHRSPTAPLASRHRGAGGGAVDNRQPQGFTYLRPLSVQSNGATSLDINKAVNALASHSSDPDGNLYDLEPWSREFAKLMAKKEGLGELSDTQWRIIYTLRGFYRKDGRATNPRQIIKRLEIEFAEEGGRKFLYETFPLGPVSQGSRIAGVPEPPYASDRSFGSVA